MKTIVKVEIADCDRSTDDDGNFTSPAFNYVVCEDFDISANFETFETREEAEKYIEDNK